MNAMEFVYLIFCCCSNHLLGSLQAFSNPPFPNFQIHTLRLVPKKNSQKWCTFYHLRKADN